MSTTTNVYCASADVTALIPPGYNTTTLSSANITAYILDASRRVDADLKDKFWPFNDTAHATIPTPSAIEQLAIWLAATRCYHKLGISGRPKPGGFVEQMTTAYHKGIEDILTDKTVIPTETASAEAITWSVEPLDDNQYKLACAPKSVIRGSVIMTGMILGADFDVRYEERYRGPILYKLSDLKNEAGSTVSTVTYDWTYYRNREIQERPNIEGGGRLELA